MAKYNKSTLYFLKKYQSYYFKDNIMELKSKPNGKAILFVFDELMSVAMNHYGYLGRQLIDGSWQAFTEEELSRLVFESVEEVHQCIETMLVYGEIEERDGMYFIEQSLISTNQTVGGDRKQKQKNKRESDENSPSKAPKKSPPNCPPEERDKKIEKRKKEKEIKIKKKDKKKINNINKKNSIVVGELLSDNEIIAENVIKYLNRRSGSSYKCESEYKKLIIGHLNNGYTYDSFVKAINNKCDDWLNTKYHSGLNPKKLFGDNFKIYTSQAPKKKSLNDISLAELEEAMKLEKEERKNKNHNDTARIH